MSTHKSLTPYKLADIELKNHFVMSPMTRNRAINNLPNELIAQYYGQRASAGLIITEGTSPSSNGLGYPRIPGIFSNEQAEAWKGVTKSVHDKGGKIFVQLMHTGRVGNTYNLPEGSRVLAPSAVRVPGQIWTDAFGMQDYSEPLAMSAVDIKVAKAEFVNAARNAVKAGFDGVELHAANGYLLEQFLSPHANRREDSYGGSIENRARFVLEVAEEVSLAIGKDKTGIRVSPYGVVNDMPHYPEIDAAYSYLAEQLNKIGIVYIHVVDHSSGGAPEVPVKIKQEIRSRFENTLILSGGYTLAAAERDITSGLADIVAIGKPFISNPDLIERFHKGLPLNITLDASTFYTAGPRGFTDYPVFEEESVSA
ncbi:MAG: alkene reductase [Marivirga sp.]|nr:alkene reductase [Marivirga sp.]